MKSTLLYGILLLLWTSGPASAIEVAGVTVPQSVSVEPAGMELVLNGAGVRRKFFIKIYVGALYLTERVHDAQAILDLAGPKRVTMHFLYSEVSAEKMVEGWNDGFSANHTDKEMESLQARLTRFNSLFRTVHKGDVIRLDFDPEQGTQVWINEERRGTVEGADFFRALLMVWLGPHPADKNLKAAMLGGSE